MGACWTGSIEALECLDGEFSPIGADQWRFVNEFVGSAYRQVEQTGTGWQKTEDFGKDQVDKRTITRKPTGQTDGTDESDIDDIFVTEACCAEIDLVLSGYGDDLANGRRRQKGHLWLY